MSFPTRKWGRGVNPRFYIGVFVFGVNQERWWAGDLLIPNTSGEELLHRPSSYRKLLDRVAFRILLNVNDGAPLWKYVERLKLIGLKVAMIMFFFTCDDLVLVIWGVGSILRNGCRIWGQNYKKLSLGGRSAEFSTIGVGNLGLPLTDTRGG